MENNNKRTLILSIIGILVLVIAVVGVSFAMFTFSGTGTKENVIKTGSISIDFSAATENNKIEITNEYPESDALGMNEDGTTFTVQGEWGNSPMTVNYSIGLSHVTPGATLTDQYVKLYVAQNGTPVMGTASAGARISTITNATGTGFEHYYITNGTLTNADKSDTYTIKAYVADDYDLPGDQAHSTSPELSGGTMNNQDSTVHQKQTASENYSFQVKVVANQVS